jgi:hypothetical protein
LPKSCCEEGCKSCCFFTWTFPLRCLAFLFDCGH